MQRALFVLAVALLVLASGCHEPRNSAGASSAAVSPSPNASQYPSGPGMPPGHAAMAHVPTTVGEWAQGAMLFTGLGDFHRKITTSSAQAQKYFDQGLRFAWAFNHDEATRSFARAAALDPQCAMCFWGVSLTVGQNYNLPFMVEERAKVAWEALGEARATAAQASPVEQALIGALAKRYPTAQPVDSSHTGPILTAYAEAMKAVAGQFPQDLDVQTLYAEAMMNINAWKLWTPDGKAARGTEEIVATLESVLTHDPEHPGANHYLVHAIEASPHPERAAAAAERLKTSMPAAGHLLHMPAHIMQRIGRYEDAAEANRRGAVADERYATLTQPLDYYPVVYTAHNYQFSAYSAAMEGRKSETLEAVKNSRRVVSDEMLLAMPGMDWYLAEAYAAFVRFGLWDEMLATPAPTPKLPALTGGYLYGRGVALAAKGRLDEARATLVELQRLAAAMPADAIAGQNAVKDVFGVAVAIVQARIAASEKRTDEAISKLRQATAAEDKLAYDEPKDWFFPARHLLGRQLLQSGKASEAESVYREDLEQNPANGWALYGLSAALKAQGKRAEAAQVTRQFQAAWRNADVTLAASAF
jgi:tetratricopeptide (TPR) repeat protein